MLLAWLLKLLWLKTEELGTFFLGVCLKDPGCLDELLHCFTILKKEKR